MEAREMTRSNCSEGRAHYASERTQSIRLGLILGVLVAIRLLAREINDPRFESSITFRQVFYWGTLPTLLGGLAVLGGMVGWLVRLIFTRGDGPEKGVYTSLNRSLCGVITAYFVSVALVNASEWVLFPLFWRSNLTQGSVANLGPLALILHLGIVLVGIVLGGYVAAFIGLRQDIRDACLLGVFMAFIGAYELRGEEPRWLAAIMIALPVPGTLAGGYLKLLTRMRENRR